MRTQLDDLQEEERNLEISLEYLRISGLEGTELYKKEEDKLHTVKSIIFNIR